MVLAAGVVPAGEPALQPPNIVLIYADDLGYGDVSCQGATRVQTPAIDRLAAEGLRFTRGHAAAATCTPSRYALLTGEYAFRRKGTGVLPGSAALIIDPRRTTLPSLLRQAGYATAVVGKWHLGLGDGDIDWNGLIQPGPREVGFDYSFIIPATGDRVPCVYVENGRVVNLDPADPIRVSYRERIGDDPTGAEHPELLKMRPSHGHDRTIVNGISRIGYMSGGHAARWVDEEMADTLTERAVRFIEEHQQQRFFLYFSYHDIHVPRVPHPRFVGSTPMGPRGDAIVQMDWCTGRILETLDRLGLTGNTLVIFTSDNGPVLDDGYQDGAAELAGFHRPAGPFRGGKYSRYEGGTRVPFIVRWPGRVQPGVSDALVNQVDLLASFARLTGRPLPAEAAPDSFDVLPALLGDSATGRDHQIEQGRALALCEGRWKYLPPARGPAVNRNVNIETGLSPEPQLYDLRDDPAERHNLAAAHPDRVRAMDRRLQALLQAGRSRPLSHP
ncbi:MAG: arylsulfatase [Verrucomicrobia bacterium]|nr:MAG: arylsulfatase [Verrucomicrobiota bacterium]